MFIFIQFNSVVSPDIYSPCAFWGLRGLGRVKEIECVCVGAWVRVRERGRNVKSTRICVVFLVGSVDCAVEPSNCLMNSVAFCAVSIKWGASYWYLSVNCWTKASESGNRRVGHRYCIPVCVRLWMIMLAYDGNIFLHTTHDFSLEIFCEFTEHRSLPADVDESKCLGDRCNGVRRSVALLFDRANSVSVCMFCTCRTHSAGVTKYIEQRSHRRAAVFSVKFSCTR